MNDLQELLSRRGTLSDAELLHALREGLAAEPAASGAAAPLHALLQGYFALDAAVSDNSFAEGLQRHDATAQALIAMMAAEGETAVVALMRSLMGGRPQPTGALAQSLGSVGADEARRHGPAVQAAFAAFAQTALASPGSAAEMELSLAWGAVEGALLDRVAGAADRLAFSHGAAHRQAQSQAQRRDELARRLGLGALLAELAAARRPRVLARPSEWDINHERAPSDWVEVPVQHRWQRTRPGPAARLGSSPAAQALAELYRFANGAELFVPLAHAPGEAGLLLIPDALWDAEREQMMVWLTMGRDDDELPHWVHSLVPFAMLNGDASRWVTPLEGPLAGSVMLSNDDVPEEQARYPSLAHFFAALRLHPHEVLGNGGYVSYAVPEHDFSLYPGGYAEDPPAR